jgi:hypothetical protein
MDLGMAFQKHSPRLAVLIALLVSHVFAASNSTVVSLKSSSYGLVSNTYLRSFKCTGLSTYNITTFADYIRCSLVVHSRARVRQPDALRHH